MWLLILRIAGHEPQELIIKNRSTSIGRDPGCDVFINDPASSREHALITYSEKEQIINLYDLESTNGTYVNQQKLEAPYRLRSGDRIRIGSSLIVAQRYGKSEQYNSAPNHASYTRELLSQAVDYHTALMYEVAQQLNKVVDIEGGLRKISTLMKIAMGAEKCEVILASQFGHLQELPLPISITQQMFDTKAAVLFPNGTGNLNSNIVKYPDLQQVKSALCVPVLLEKKIVAMIYLDKEQSSARNFDLDDMHLVVAISHHTALTIHRMNLMEQLSEETKIRQTLLRFVSPQETEYLLKDGLSIGQLPGLSKQSATILFADITASTRLAEKLGAQNFGKLLNQFYLDVTNIVFKYNGIVRYLGDGVMAIFLNQGANSMVSKVAVNTGLEILHYVKTSQLPATIGVTVKSGEVVVGYVGNEERVEFTVLGDVVNVAHGMQSYARPNKLIVGSEIIESIQFNKNYSLKSLKPIKLEHRKRLVEVYEILEKRTIGSDTIPVERLRSGTSELIKMLPQRMSKDLLP